MAKPGATQQPYSVALHSHKCQYKYLNFKIYFFTPMGGGEKQPVANTSPINNRLNQTRMNSIAKNSGVFFGRVTYSRKKALPNENKNPL